MQTTHRLYLLRHAQASPGGPSDHGRRLDGQGESDARSLGRLLVARSIAPARAIASDSARTRGTWTCLEAAGLASEIAFEPQLYNGSEDTYRTVIEAAGPDDLLVIGHNPTIGNLARALAADGDRTAMDALARGFPTCALAVLRFDHKRDGAFLETLMMPPHPPR